MISKIYSFARIIFSSIKITTNTFLFVFFFYFAKLVEESVFLLSFVSTTSNKKNIIKLMKYFPNKNEIAIFLFQQRLSLFLSSLMRPAF